MKQTQKPIQVFGAAVSNDEIEALANLAAQVRRGQPGYKAYVAVFFTLGAIMLFFGIVSVLGNVGLVSYVILICAIIVLYLVLYGNLASVKAAYRRAAGAQMDTNYTPVFGQDGVQLHSDDEEEQLIPWSEINAYTRCSHGLWLISEKGRDRHVAVHVNADQTAPSLFEKILNLLAENGVKEINTEG